jgi:hypothetical protein
MKWSHLVSLTLLAYFISMSVHAQPANNPATPDSTPDSMSIEDSGGSLRVVPKTQQPSAVPQAPPGQMQISPPQGAQAQPSPDGVDMNPSSPQGELQEPSNSNQSMMPAGPQQDSMPNPNQGSMQN